MAWHVHGHRAISADAAVPIQPSTCIHLLPPQIIAAFSRENTNQNEDKTKTDEINRIWRLLEAEI